jgi:hypothetical protein
MKAIALVVCASLSSCALAGLEGPQRQARAQAALRDLPNELAPTGGYVSSSDVEDQPAESVGSVVTLINLTPLEVLVMEGK